MGTDAETNDVVALAKAPLGIGPLSEDAIRDLVNRFYIKVRTDPELGPIFERAIPGDWGPHLATMHGDAMNEHVGDRGSAKNYPISSEHPSHGQDP